MSSGHHGPNWYKLFLIALGLFYIFLLVMVSECSISISDASSAASSALCVVYGAATFACFLLGLFVSLIGLEHAKRTGRKSKFFYLSIVFFFAGLAAIILYIVI